MLEVRVRAPEEETGEEVLEVRAPEEEPRTAQHICVMCVCVLWLPCLGVLNISHYVLQSVRLYNVQHKKQEMPSST